MQQLFIASLVCKLFAYLPEKLTSLSRVAIAGCVIFIFMAVNAKFFVWICAAIMGYVLRVLLDTLDRKSVNVGTPLLSLSFIAALILIKTKLDEGVLQYSLQAIAAFLLIFIQFNMNWAKRILSVSPFPWLGGISMGLFVTHTPVYSILHSSVYPILSRILPSTAAILIYLILALALSTLCAWILKTAYDASMNLLTKRKVAV